MVGLGVEGEDYLGISEQVLIDLRELDKYRPTTTLRRRASRVRREGCFVRLTPGCRLLVCRYVFASRLHCCCTVHEATSTEEKYIRIAKKDRLAVPRSAGGSLLNVPGLSCRPLVHH